MYAYQTTKELKDVNDRVDSMLAKKTKIKDIKNKYRKEYMDKQSGVGKIITKITNSDKTYSDVMYNLNKS